MSVTYSEILQQPDSWRQTVEQVPGIWKTIESELDRNAIAHAVFVGCGTSLYIAQTAAHTFTELTGKTASAVPASEVFLSASSILPRTGSIVAFVISRSGTTSEGLLAADFLRSWGNRVHTVAITCHDETPLAAKCDSAIELPFAAEVSVVMTQSFTTMLLALQIVAAVWSDNETVLDELATIPNAFRNHLPAFERFARKYGETTEYDATIFLGLGPYQGLAQEATLKLKEMTQQSCEAYNPLEFRHGPISIVDGQSLVILVEGQREAAYIEDVERDLKQHGASVARLAPYDSSVVENGLIIGGDLSDLARGCLYLPALQLLAVYRAQSSGLDPDRPRNLNQVVVLNER